MNPKGPHGNTLYSPANTNIIQVWLHIVAADQFRTRDERKNTHAHDFIVQTNDGGAISSKDSREKVTVDMLHVYALYVSQL